ncbi:unnamed protein product [Peniophora sp. CBMAI 1063]|nr:unnamed protein product [Peniophora sp. CBMAI 1063]
MPSFASRVAEAISPKPDQLETTKGPSRLHVSQKTKERAKGAMKTVIELLVLASAMTQNVPYLGAISAVLNAFSKMVDEVDVLKDEWSAAMQEAQMMSSMIIDFRGRCLRHAVPEQAFDEDIRRGFTYLEKAVLESIEVLSRCEVRNWTSTRILGHLRLYSARSVRSNLRQSVRDCCAKMMIARNRFDFTLQISQLTLLEDIHREIHDVNGCLVLRAPPAVRAEPPALWNLALSESMRARTSALPLPRAAPPIFYGRQEEMSHIISCLLNDQRARIPILGPVGIGKTSIARQVLHHPDTATRYGDRRFFVTCRSTANDGGILSQLDQMIGVLDGDGEGRRPDPLQRLRHTGGLICVDDYQRGDSEEGGTEDDNIDALLIEIDSMSSVALILTSRMTNLPPIRWSLPRLEVISPLRIEDSVQIWKAICGGHDRYSLQLIRAVDRVPAALVILARLARSQTSRDIWSLWKSYDISPLVRKVESQLETTSSPIECSYTMDKAIRASLDCLRDVDACLLLRLLSLFPKGIERDHIYKWAAALERYLNVRQALTLLREHSLIQYEKHPGRSPPHSSRILLRVLAPIRQYMSRYHSEVPDDILSQLIAMYCDPGDRHFIGYSDSGIHCLDMALRKLKLREQCLRLIAHGDDITAFCSHAVLVRANNLAYIIQSHTERKLCLRVAHIYERRGDYEEAYSAILSAIQFDERTRDVEAGHEDWAELARLKAAHAWSSNDLQKLDLEARLRSLSEAQYALDRSHELASATDQDRKNAHQNRIQATVIDQRKQAVLRLTTSRKSHILSSRVVGALSYQLGMVGSASSYLVRAAVSAFA